MGGRVGGWVGSLIHPPIDERPTHPPGRCKYAHKIEQRRSKLCLRILISGFGDYGHLPEDFSENGTFGMAVNIANACHFSLLMPPSLGWAEFMSTVLHQTGERAGREGFRRRSAPLSEGLPSLLGSISNDRRPGVDARSNPGSGTFYLPFMDICPSWTFAESFSPES